MITLTLNSFVEARPQRVGGFGRCKEMKTTTQRPPCKRCGSVVSNALMKPCRITLAIVVAFGLPLIATAQDDPVTIVGELSDGTPPQIAPKPELPPVVIRETKIVQLPDRQLTIHRVADPGLPDPRPKIPERQELSEEEIEAFRNSPAVQLWVEEAAKTSHLFISATVIDGRATFLRWWHDGAEYQAWSNADWMILTGFAECQKGDKRFVSLLMAGRMNSANLPADSPYRIPDDLPAEPGSYRITKGDLTDTEAYEGIAALHELYRSDYTRLKQAYELRVQRRREREAALRANPPVPEDIVLRYWKIEPKRTDTVQAEGGEQ